MSDLGGYAYRGARALVLLHEKALRDFIPTWRRAAQAAIPLPATDDPDYASLESLLHHVLRAARGYMTWLCEKLGLPDPGIDPAPAPGGIAKAVDGYVEHLLSRWRSPLSGVPEERFSRTHKTRWGVDMSCESMLEHAVVHPLRHTFQLGELLESRAGGEAAL